MTAVPDRSNVTLLDLYERALPQVYGYLMGRGGDGAVAEDLDDPGDVSLDRWRAQEVLSRLAPQHRAALTLRYLDGLPVGETAAILDRSVTATETLLVRARREFRHVYEGNRDA